MDYKYSFQADAGTVNEVYNHDNNYIIEYSSNVSPEYCIVYFSSNDLYYPNSDAAFIETIIEKNRFEWYKCRVNYGFKHIFIRDIKKQWYLGGINNRINSPQKLFEFLKTESSGYKLILIGSSAGGFIATILGQMLNAYRIYSFNGQFEINSLLNNASAEIVNPLLFRFRTHKEIAPFYDTTNFINNPLSIYYFHSLNNKWDIEQAQYVERISINKISFLTSNHGVPFLKTNLPNVINMDADTLNRLVGKTFHPINFSLLTVGLYETLKGGVSIFKFVLNKIYISTLQKLKK